MLPLVPWKLGSCQMELRREHRLSLLAQSEGFRVGGTIVLGPSSSCEGNNLKVVYHFV